MVLLQLPAVSAGSASQAVQALQPMLELSQLPPSQLRVGQSSHGRRVRQPGLRTLQPSPLVALWLAAQAAHVALRPSRHGHKHCEQAVASRWLRFSWLQAYS